MALNALTIVEEIALAVENEVKELTTTINLDSLENALTDIIMGQTKNYHSNKTGGTLHEIDRPTAQRIAQLVMVNAPLNDLQEVFVIAGLSGESACDPNAINPNWQDAKPGENSFQAFNHLDLGACQFDGSTLLEADGIFADLKGLTLDEVKAKALDIEWAIPHYCKYLRKLLDDTHAEVLADPSLLDNVPNHDEMVLATEGYNAGERGAELIAKYNGNWAYALGWIARYNTYSKMILGIK